VLKVFWLAVLANLLIMFYSRGKKLAELGKRKYNELCQIETAKNVVKMSRYEVAATPCVDDLRTSATPAVTGETAASAMFEQENIPTTTITKK